MFPLLLFLLRNFDSKGQYHFLSNKDLTVGHKGRRYLFSYRKAEGHIGKLDKPPHNDTYIRELPFHNEFFRADRMILHLFSKMQLKIPLCLV